MRFLKVSGILTLIYITWVVLADIAGALAVTILPEPDMVRLNGHAGFGSTALYYTVWIVAGCFAGVFYTMGSLEATQKYTPVVVQYPFILFSAALVLSAVSIAWLYAAGEMNVYVSVSTGNYYVPGHRYMTYAFFASFLLACLLLIIIKKKAGTETTRQHPGREYMYPVAKENDNPARKKIVPHAKTSKK